MSRTTKGPRHIHSLRSLCFIKKSAFNVTGNLVIVVKFTFQSAFGNYRQNRECARTRQCARSQGDTRAVFYPLIWLANIKTKSLRHGNRFGTRGRRRYFSERERSDDRKYVCASQATAVQKGLNNYDLPHYSLFFYKSHVRRLVTSCLSLLLFGVKD